MKQTEDPERDPASEARDDHDSEPSATRYHVKSSTGMTMGTWRDRFVAQDCAAWLNERAMKLQTGRTFHVLPSRP